MTGFFFADKHSRDFWMAMEDAGRPLRPEMRRNDYEIPGRHGTVNFGGETYNTRQIAVEFCFISDNVKNLQKVARELAYWLSGAGNLWFDDEPDKAYDAIVYEPIETEQIIRTKRATVIFECQPLAKTVHHLQSINTGVSSGQIIPITSHGTHPTPCLIFLRNTGTNSITSIRISRRAMQR